MRSENCPPSLHRQNTTSYNRGFSRLVGSDQILAGYYGHGATRAFRPGVYRSRLSARSFQRGAGSRADWFSCGLCSESLASAVGADRGYGDWLHGPNLIANNVRFRGVKRTWLFAAQMSAFDPKRTSTSIRTTPRCPRLHLLIWLKDRFSDWPYKFGHVADLLLAVLA